MHTLDSIQIYFSKLKLTNWYIDKNMKQNVKYTDDVEDNDYMRKKS